DRPSCLADARPLERPRRSGSLMESRRARSLGYLLVGLADLADKYAALADLHAGVPGRTPERRDAMRKIAARFPAALREFDQTTREELARRAREIDRVLGDLLGDLERSAGLLPPNSRELDWLRAAAELHAYLRELLKVKRWLSGREVTAELLPAFATWHADSGDPRWPLEHWTRDRLSRIAAPPRGRVTDLAYEEIAARHGLDPIALRRALYPSLEHEGE